MFCHRSSLLFLASWILLSSCDEPASVTPVTVPSGEYDLAGRFFSPAGGGLHPVVVLIPGWPGNPEDVIGLGSRLSSMGINAVMVLPKGMHQSEGEFTFHGSLDDIGAAFRWVHRPEVIERFGIDTTAVFLCGDSWGGGMSLAYAASDHAVRRVISVAGTDHGEFIREFERNEAWASAVRGMLLSNRAPQGPIRFDDLDAVLREITEGQHVFGLRENAPQLADRSILLLGAWDDVSTTIEGHLMPLYRALRANGAEDLTFLVYHDDHDLLQVRDTIAVDIAEWIRRKVKE